jgi:hypothetical protein
VLSPLKASSRRSTETTDWFGVSRIPRAEKRAREPLHRRPICP